MQNKITYFKTGKEVSNDFYTLLANVNCCCLGELKLVNNERADASYRYQLWCPECRKSLCKIDWYNEIITVNCAG